MKTAATFQRKSCNSKLSRVLQLRYKNTKRFQTFPQAPFVASTYVSIEATCPDTCRFKNAGCYVQTGQSAHAMRRMDAGANEHHMTHPNVVEANLIDEQWKQVPQDGPGGKGRPLRLHVGGDVRDTEGANALAQACNRYLQRDGGPVWNYTHRWREVSVSAWGPAISTLASLETIAEAVEATDIGYMPSFTMASFDGERAYKVGSGIKVVPCPAQTRNLKCIDCKLCFKKLSKGTAIGFAWHGRGGSGKRKLDVIQRERFGQQTLGFG